MSPTANQHDAIDAVELALADYEELFGRSMVDDCPVDEQTGEVLPVVTIVTDNGARSARSGSRRSSSSTPS
ncbi:hypothetical protein [Dermabacter sp. HMSC06F07]|uniref:hypothetical protein n=1 Tax=Dermabacter sp. HMSC06F07 TaxID=1581125 RepID=UPI001FED87AA|nr:hypothetical protein [Dermabacter sp. HMSC06F07]